MTTGHDLAALMKFAKRAEWADAFEDTLADHFAMALDTLDLEYDDVPGLLGDHWAGTLWGCAFEDFLTRRVAPDGRNIVEDYLKQRGGKESPRNRTYIAALRSSCMSLHEVSDIVPGQSFRARDLVRGGEPVLVHERSATQSLKPWQKVAARLVPVGERTVMGGGVLPFSQEAAAVLLQGLTKAEDEGGKPTEKPTAPDPDMLRRAAPLFTTAWLLDVLPKALGEMPAVFNGDGEEPVFHQFRYPLAKGVRQTDIAARLATIGALSPVRARFWDWLGDDTGRTAAAKDTVAGPMLEAITPDGRIILDHVELKGRFLILTTNSVSRAERATAMLEEALGECLLAPTTRIETLDETMEESRERQEETSELPPEIAASLVHRFLDRQHRRTLDEPVPMLGNLSPRAAAANDDERAKVADWLKYLENRSAGVKDPGDPMATYDFAWMWKELGLEDLRRRSLP